MAADEVRSQTGLVVQFLLNENVYETDGGEFYSSFFSTGGSHCECKMIYVCVSGAGGDAAAFDPQEVARKLRDLGDEYDERRIQPLIRGIREAAANQVRPTEVFVSSVNNLCEAWLGQRAEVAPERDLLRASVALGLYVKKNCPDMVQNVQRLLTSFLNARLADWISAQGGWVSGGHARHQNKSVTSARHSYAVIRS
uniref:Bcl-2-like protein 15 n=1 Tax=Denticeps clupeoides TaxID=299321 RepID=A0AAY4DBF4_9TELE